jgi:hypothetical protein
MWHKVPIVFASCGFVQTLKQSYLYHGGGLETAHVIGASVDSTKLYSKTFYTGKTTA